MSRVAKKPIIIPSGTEVNIHGSEIKVKGPKGTMQFTFQEMVGIKKENNEILFFPNEKIENADAIAGTTRALIGNMVIGVTNGFNRK